MQSYTSTSCMSVCVCVCVCACVCIYVSCMYVCVCGICFLTVCMCVLGAVLILQCGLDITVCPLPSLFLPQPTYQGHRCTHLRTAVCNVEFTHSIRRLDARFNSDLDISLISTSFFPLYGTHCSPFMPIHPSFLFLDGCTLVSSSDLSFWLLPNPPSPA